MTTKLSKKTRIPIPKDIQPGDVLVLRNGRRKIWEKWDIAGESWCEGINPGGHCPDGRWWGRESFAPHKWDVVAIERKSQPKKPRMDKDAAWLLNRLENYIVEPLPRKVASRIRAIAKRLNGGVAP